VPSSIGQKLGYDHQQDLAQTRIDGDEQWRSGKVETVVSLVPVRTDSAWFHETLSPDADIYLLRGRVRFLNTLGRSQHTPFSLMVLTLGATRKQRDRYAELVQGFWLVRGVRAVSGDQGRRALTPVE